VLGLFFVGNMSEWSSTATLRNLNELLVQQAALLGQVTEQQCRLSYHGYMHSEKGCKEASENHLAALLKLNENVKRLIKRAHDEQHALAI
jgi:hypothetical protein